ncbi:endonuclease/exonuclease/phosphatase family protein [Apostichopus japonicus]|uniref:Endonuclease/exonuclease/phosphatase family protein n=1 Tax=Stichopus japonicus TaxID=307972 RepID=A0A2G8JKN5_STIJA|nr:endonuclease/exonuclease/phosphatase family protein [Apostichopus japonicus]
MDWHGHFQSNGCKVFFSGHERIKRNGVALICNKTTAASVLGYNPVNDRMISIRLDGHPVKTTNIQVYASTSAASDEDTQNFYGRLQDLVDSVPRGDALVIMGDWNAKVREEAVAGISGRHGLGERNEAGERMLDFCEANRLVISNTLFQQPTRRLYTWTSPDGQYRNQIDYILVRKRWQSAVKSANTLPGAYCGTDHELLVAIIHIKLRKVKKQDRVYKYSLNDIPERYNIEVKNSFGELDLSEREPDELWQEARKDKEYHLNIVCSEIEADNQRGRTRDVFKKIRDITGEFKLRVGSLKRNAGEGIYEDEAPIIEEEVRKAVKSLANGKSPGSDELPIELFKEVGDEGVTVLTVICQRIWCTGVWPKRWKESIYMPIPRKGDPRICSNNRTIALISHASKVMLKVIQHRLEGYMERNERKAMETMESNKVQAENI